MYKVYKYRVDENNEIISCCLSRRFKTRELAMRFFNRLANADFIDYELETECIKRNGKIL